MAANYDGRPVAVAASQSNSTLQVKAGAIGDYIHFILVVPATTSPGAVSIADGSDSAVTIFTGGAGSVSNLVPFVVPVMSISRSGAWKVTTGANVSIVAVGRFS